MNRGAAGTADAMAGEQRAVEESWTLQTLLRDIARHGERPALVSVRGEALEVWSFARLADHAGRLAYGLLRAGLAPGEAVLLFAPNGPEWVVVRLALGAAGALAVPVDDLSTPEEVAAVLRDAGCRRAFTTRAHVPALRAMKEAAGLEVFVLDGEAAPEDGPRDWREVLAKRAGPLPPPDAEAPAMLIYTSGTTGPPKSFTLTCANVWANVRALVAEGLLGPGDRVLLPLPLHHVYPFIVGLLVPLASGAAVVFPEAVAGPQIVQALRAARASVMVGVPRLYAALFAGLTARVAARGTLAAAAFRALLGFSVWLRRRFGVRAGRVLFRGLHAGLGKHLRLMVSGGAQLRAELVWNLEGLGWEVRSGYGLAETASIFTGNLPGRERIGSEGRPFQGGEICIAEPDERGVGEIQLRGSNVFTGYRNDPAANRAAFTGDGWFRTGDLGRLDPEGYLHFCGRAKEMIVLGGGKNVSPEDLESAYAASPFIREVAVLERDGALHALVLPDVEAIKASGTVRVEDSVRVALTTAARRLPSYQRLAGFALVREPLPRTRLGKYQRFLLPELYERARKGARRPAPAEISAEDRALLREPPAREVWRLLEARYPDKPLALDASPQLDLGIDSLEWVTISLELERRLGLRLSEEAVAEATSVRDLLRAVVAATRTPRAAGPGEPSAGEDLLADRARWTEPTGFGPTLLGISLFLINWLILRIFFRLRVDGAERLPAPGPFVIVANHASDLDPLALGAALPLRHLRRTYWGGDVARLFASPLRRFACRVLHIFPIDERAPTASLAMAAAVLARGCGVIWFPEAWRSPTGELQRFLPGIGTLVEQTRARVVPAYIRGTFEAMPRWRRVPRPHPIRVGFGGPLEAEELAAMGRGGTAEARITDALERAVAELGAAGAGAANGPQTTSARQRE